MNRPEKDLARCEQHLLSREIVLYNLYFKFTQAAQVFAKACFFLCIMTIYWYMVLTYVVGWYQSSIHVVASVSSVILSTHKEHGGILENLFFS